jgi:hypothetical protein
VTRSLRLLDPAISRAYVQEFVARYDENDILRARNATVRMRPANVKAFFESQFKGHVPVVPVVPVTAAPLRAAPPLDDPYAF